MLQLFAAYLTLTNAFSDVEDLTFAIPPSFGSYNLQKQEKKLPLINLEETCFSSKLQDDSTVAYQVGGFSETLSCAEAFEMHKSMYSGDVCNYGYHLNDEQDTLLDRCGETFCSECAQVENTDEDIIYAKEVFEDDIGYAMAPGFEISPSEGKEAEVQGIAAPIPRGDFDDASLPNSLPVIDVEPKAMPALIPSSDDYAVVEGMEAPLQDTAVEGHLDAPMMQVEMSMVPPGFEAEDVQQASKLRLNRYSGEL